MFLNISISNFKGISSQVDIDCKALPKKRESNKIFITKDGVKINKIIGIIGKNACGKTSIIDALCLIEDFIKRDVDLEQKKHKYIGYQNDKSKDTTFVVDLYIPQGEITGYYQYSFTYNEHGIRESLKYKKNYRNKWNVIIDFENDRFISELLFRYKYYRNYIFHSTNDNNDFKICNTFFEHYLDSCVALNSSELYGFFEDSIENEKQLRIIQKYLNIIDTSIEKCTYEDDSFIFYNKKGKKLNMGNLSDGSIRFLDIIFFYSSIMQKQGTLFIDEIENHFSMDVLNLIYKLFMADMPIQLVFTTNNEYVFDEKNHTIRYIDNDQIYILKKDYTKIEAVKSEARYDKIFSKDYNNNEKVKFLDKEIEELYLDILKTLSKL